MAPGGVADRWGVLESAIADVVCGETKYNYRGHRRIGSANFLLGQGDLPSALCEQDVRRDFANPVVKDGGGGRPAKILSSLSIFVAPLERNGVLNENHERNW